MNLSPDDLILLNIAGIGYIKLKALSEHFESTGDILKAPTSFLRRFEGIGAQLAQKISSVRESGALEREKDLIASNGVSVVSVFDNEYPVNLKNIYDPPTVLYIKGEISKANQIAVAMVGSRKASIHGVDICYKLSRELAECGITVVSGLARGIYSAAHSGALGAGGRTLAILGHGLSIIYPPENGKLADEIAKNRGALISEFPMNHAPIPRNFPVRNRVISGLALGCVVVEAARTSGALISARCALNEGREVFSVPGRVGSATSSGVNGLIREGAKLVESVEDILDELNLDLKYPSISTNSVSVDLKPEEERLYKMLSDRPEHIDNIITESELPAQDVTAQLVNLQIKGLVKELPGKNYVNIN